jgi:hypothetical protein
MVCTPSATASRVQLPPWPPNQLNAFIYPPLLICHIDPTFPISIVFDIRRDWGWRVRELLIRVRICQPHETFLVTNMRVFSRRRSILLRSTRVPFEFLDFGHISLDALSVFAFSRAIAALRLSGVVVLGHVQAALLVQCC